MCIRDRSAIGPLFALFFACASGLLVGTGGSLIGTGTVFFITTAGAAFSGLVVWKTLMDLWTPDDRAMEVGATRMKLAGRRGASTPGGRVWHGERWRLQIQHAVVPARIRIEVSVHQHGLRIERKEPGGRAEVSLGDPVLDLSLIHI